MKILYLFYVHMVIALYDNPLECNGNKRLDQYVCDKDLPTGGRFADTNDSLFDYIKHVYLINCKTNQLVTAYKVLYHC